MRFLLQNNFVKDVRRFAEISVLDASVYEQLNICIKRAEQLLSKGQKICM